MDSINQNATSPVNNWFSSNIEYKGRGHAEFQDPKGILEGSVKIQFDEFGKSMIEMDIDSYESEPPIRDLIEFFRINLNTNPNPNPCTSLTVITSEGTYSAIGHIFYNPVIVYGDNQSSITFYLVTSQFDITEAGVPKYWMFPLFNFVSEFRQRELELDNHPLRIRPRPNNSDHLITFDFNNKLGFIEPLADFKKRKERLYSGEIQGTITAVMVGEVGSESIDITNMREWLPFGFLTLLGLATGIRVGIPWIELRDVNGGLVRRFHEKFSKPPFSKGHTTICEIYYQGTGYLLTRAQSSQYYAKEPLFPVISDLIQAGADNLTIEDKLSKIGRAFDSLCKHFELDRQTLLLNLDPNHKVAVQEALRNAVHNIRSAANSTNDNTQKLILEKIADRTNNASNIDRDFGLAVIDLIQNFNLPDADIVNSYYQNNPRPDNKNWNSVLSDYRGLAVHSGYFDFPSGKYDVKDVTRITLHLYDILVRIIFKMLEYDLTYQPIILGTGNTHLVDWVTPDIPGSKLGY